MTTPSAGGRKGPGKSIWIGLLFALILLALMYYASRGLSQHSCEVCIAYGNGSACRVAEGSTQEEATQTATSLACSGLAFGMAESINCSNTPPQSVDCGY